MRQNLSEEVKAKIIDRATSDSRVIGDWLRKAIDLAYDLACKDFRVGPYRSKRDYNKVD